MRRKILLLFAVLLSIPLFGQTNISSIVKKTKPAVVTIITYDENGDTLSLGSGFFVTADGTRLYLEAKTYCFTFGLLEGLVLDAKVGPVDVEIFYNNETYEYWIEDEY